MKDDLGARDHDGCGPVLDGSLKLREGRDRDRDRVGGDIGGASRNNQP